MCHAPRKAYYGRFLHDPLPVESHLDHSLADALNAEVCAAGTVASKQDAVDWLTWTLLYRRLARNPNYYGMPGASHRHLSDHLSELVEATCADLVAGRAIAEDEQGGGGEGGELSPLNLGMVAAYYCVSYATVELMAASLTAKTRAKGLLAVVAAAAEFESLPVRPGDDEAVRRLLAHAPVAVDAQPEPGDPHAKANALLQAHLSRAPLPGGGASGELAADQRRVARDAARLLQAAVDVVASGGWLTPALAAMEMCQMVAQAMWDRDSPLMQLPHIGRAQAQALGEGGEGGGGAAPSVFDLADMDPRAELEPLLRDKAGLVSAEERADVARVCARYPDVSVTTELVGVGGDGGVEPGGSAALSVALVRDNAAAALDPATGALTPAHAPRFPGRRDEGWWLVLGDPRANRLYAVKRVALAGKAKAKLAFELPAAEALLSAKGGEGAGASPSRPRALALTLFLMCDSWVGCDQEFEVTVPLRWGAGEEEGAAAMED
jgi:pre-mRNA-splicing helicase BRR2